LKAFSLLGCCSVALAFTAASCTGAPHDFTADVREVCNCAGLTQTGAVAVTTNPRDKYTVVDFDVSVDGETRRYHAHFNQRRFLYNFLPQDFAQYMTNIYLDTFRDENVRSAIIERVTKLNDCLNWKLYGNPIIRKVGNAFVVTYSAMPEDMLKKRQSLISPYISFIVSSRGYVIGAYYEAGA
jgi:hypothetical protein